MIACLLPKLSLDKSFRMRNANVGAYPQYHSGHCGNAGYSQLATPTAYAPQPSDAPPPLNKQHA